MEQTVPLVLLEEMEVKSLKNAKGEPYKLHRVKARSSTKGKEFEIIMFLDEHAQVELNKEKMFTLVKTNRGDGWVAKEVKAQKAVGAAGTRPFFNQKNHDLEIQKIALEAAVALVEDKSDLNKILLNQTAIVKHIKSNL